MKVSRIVSIYFFKNGSFYEVSFIFRNFWISLIIGVLNKIVNLLTWNLLIMLVKFSLCLNLQNINAWWYTYQTIFFLMLLLIVSDSWILFAVSSVFSTILAFFSMLALFVSSFSNDLSILLYFFFGLLIWFIGFILTAKSFFSNKENWKIK